MRFRDKVVLITGASGGIGQKLVAAFADEDALIGAVYHEHQVQFPAGVLSIKANLADPQDAELAINACEREFGPVDILIHGAATTANNFVEQMTFEEWQRVLAVNLTSAFNVVKHVLPRMKERKSGHIVNLSSIVGEVGAIGCANYAASKAGLVGFTRALAKEVCRDGIFVNALVLGYFNVGLGEKLPPKIREKITEMIPLGRFGDPAEIVKAVFFLAETNYMSGATLRLSGGL
ncbi:MAG: SDR family oxidoreductase [bacterium]|nr:SDR family oxidoreductase [bacterium]